MRANVIACAGAGFLALGVVGPLNAEPPQPAPQAAPKPQRLEKVFGGLRGGFGKKNTDKVVVVSGPEVVKLGRGGAPGRMWKVKLGASTFKISIEDKVKMEVADVFGRLERLPTPYRRAFEIVSEDKKDGIAFYADLDGAAAHGGQDYLNIVRNGDALVIAHESGHILEQRFSRSNPKTLDLWKDAIAKDKVSVSGYGDHVAHEDLAEFSMIYALCLDAGPERLAELKRLSPERFAIWEKILQSESTR